MKGLTGRALTDPEPLISKDQYEADREVFMASAREDRRVRRVISSREYMTAQREAKAAERQALIEKYAPLRAARKGHTLAPGTHAAVRLLASQMEKGHRKWSWMAIGEMVGINSVTAREIADASYAKQRQAYMEAA